MGFSPYVGQLPNLEVEPEGVTSRNGVLPVVSSSATSPVLHREVRLVLGMHRQVQILQIAQVVIIVARIVVLIAVSIKVVEVIVLVLVLGTVIGVGFQMQSLVVGV